MYDHVWPDPTHWQQEHVLKWCQKGCCTCVRWRYSELDFLYSGPFIMWTQAKCLWGENTCYNLRWPQLLVPALQSGASDLDYGPFKDAPFITLQDQWIENNLLRKVSIALPLSAYLQEVYKGVKSVKHRQLALPVTDSPCLRAQQLYISGTIGKPLNFWEK